jgi:hypothetical protein
MSNRKDKPAEPQRPRPTVSRPFLVAGGLAAAAVAAGLGWWMFGGGGRAGAPASENSRFRAGLRVGCDLEYAVESYVDLRSVFRASIPGDAPPPAAFAQRTTATVRGRLITTSVGRDSGGRFILSLRVSGARVTIESGGQSAADAAARTAEDLDRGLFVSADPNGRVRTAFGAGAAALSHSFALELAAVGGLVLPESAVENAAALRDPAASWETLEEDAGGEFTVRYTAESADGPHIRKFRRERRPYETPGSAAGNADAVVPIRYRPAGDAAVSFDFSLPAVIGAESDTRADLSVAGRPAGHIRVRTRLASPVVETIDEGVRRELEKAARAAGAGRSFSFADFRTAPPDPRAGYTADLGDTALEQILARLDEVDRAEKPDEAADGLPAILRAAIYLRAEDCAALGLRLLKSPANRPSTGLIASALARVGTEPAQKELVAAVRARAGDPAALTLLLPALGGVARPTAETEAALREAAGAADAGVRTTAQLALGAAVRGMIESAPERAKALTDGFVRALRAASDDTAVRQWLLVLGNTGHPDALEPIAATLGSTNPAVRAAAVGSLRFIPDRRVGPFLLRVLRQDASADVRFEAAWAMRFRPADAASVAAAGERLASEPAEAVRLELVEFLQQSRRSFPEAIAALDRAAAGDASEKVRRAAQEPHRP